MAARMAFVSQPAGLALVDHTGHTIGWRTRLLYVPICCHLFRPPPLLNHVCINQPLLRGLCESRFSKW